MCGICGYIDKKGNKVDQAIFSEMTDIITHRGPDDVGFFYEDNIALSHRRLSIIDLSKDGQQPMHYLERYVIVFNGEIYNYIELRKTLEEKGYSFNSKTDTEIILAAYDCWGKKCLNKFNGMWSFILYDKKNREVFCSRDRFGIKPFYYYIDNNKIMFASEIKQLLIGMKNKVFANKEHVWNFLCCGLTEYNDDTFFENIKQLRGGYCGIYNLHDNSWHVEKWYELKVDKDIRNNSYSKEAERFKDILMNSVELRMRADVTVGSCLSGGLDSSAIVCVASKILEEQNISKKPNTVSSCYNSGEEIKYDEQEYIDKVINDTKAISNKIFISFDSMYKELDDIIWHMDEPFTTTSICAQWFVFKKAKELGLTVMLDGQGADEQLAGYSSFYAPAFAEMIKENKIFELLDEMKWFDKYRKEAEGVSALSYLKSAVSSLENDVKCSDLKKNLIKFIAKFKEKKESGVNVDSSSLKFPFDMTKANPPILYPSNDFDRFSLDMIRVNLSSLLHFEDRNSMAHSIESRVPFLDYRLVEEVVSMPHNYKIRKGVTKSVMREGLKGILTEDIRNRYSKLGFATPEDVWMKNNTDFFKAELESACDLLSSVVEKNKVMEWFEGCIKQQKRDYLSFRIICLAHWMKIFNVQWRD